MAPTGLPPLSIDIASPRLSALPIPAPSLSRLGSPAGDNGQLLRRFSSPVDPVTLNGRTLQKLPVPGQSSTFPAPLMPSSAEVYTQNATNRELGAQQRLGYLQNAGSGIQQIAHPVDASGNPTGGHQGLGWKLLGGLARAGDIALSLAAPGVEALTPGTEGHHQLLLGQQEHRLGEAQGELQKQAVLEDSQAQAAQRGSLAQQEQARAEALLHPKPSNGQLLYDKNGSPIGFQGGDGTYFGPNDSNLPQGVRDVLAGAQRKQPTNAFELWQSQNPKGRAEDYLKLEADGKNKPLEQQLIDAESSGDTDLANTIRHVIQETRVQPRIDVHTGTEKAPAVPHQLVYVPQADGTTRAVEVTPGTVIPTGATKTPGGEHISADEQKRADLAQNLNENIDRTEEILNRRGKDLFGGWHGYMTQLRGAVGTNDPDIAALESIKHQLGMVAQGAHGMRSAQGVESAANALLNNFHNSPEATRAALESARKSVATFLQNSQSPGQPRSAAPSGMVQVQIPGHQPGYIPRESLKQFQRDNPGAKVVQ